MIKVSPNNEQIEFAKMINEEHNWGQRGYGDGNKSEQFTGILGQIVLSDLLNYERTTGSSGFDEGTDFIINNRKVDVKTMGRTVDVKDHYVHNFIGYQMKFDTHYYIFQSYNRTRNELSICGLVSKQELIDKAEFFKKGEIRTRDDGTIFINKAPLFEIKQSDLYQVYSVQDLFKKIR